MNARGEHGAAISRPIVLHCRKAFDDLIPILARTALEPGRFVFHCFTGNEADMGKVLDFGAMVSFTGVITYKNAAEVRAAAKMVPRDRIMVETDAPFLAPEPYRGKTNEPAYVTHTGRYLADLLKIDKETFATHSKNNFFSLFTKAKKTWMEN